MGAVLRRRALLAALLLCTITSCEIFRPKEPLPPSKAAFVGVWRSDAGFVLRVRADGTASLAQVPDTAGPEARALNLPAAPPVLSDLRVEFRGDSALLLITPLLYARVYRIDRPPLREGDAVRMVLNGVTLRRR